MMSNVMNGLQIYVQSMELEWPEIGLGSMAYIAFLGEVNLSDVL